MEPKIIERRNLLISSLFRGASKISLAPDQLLNATLFVWQRDYKARGVRKKVTLKNLKIEDRQISLLALNVSFGLSREALYEAFEISESTYLRSINMMSVALLSSHKYQKRYADFCLDVQYYAKWHYQHRH